jgi:hypothetical protein
MRSKSSDKGGALLPSAAMKALTSMLIAVIVSSSLAGCLVRTRTHSHQSQSRVRSCPPAHHWENGACVHNGRGHGKRR